MFSYSYNVSPDACDSSTGNFVNEDETTIMDGYMEIFPVVGARLDFPPLEIDSPSYPVEVTGLTMRYANGTSNDLAMDLYVGGNFHATVNFPPTGSWDTFGWLSASLDVAVPPGVALAPQVSLIATSPQTSLPRIHERTSYVYRYSCGLQQGWSDMCGITVQPSESCPSVLQGPQSSNNLPLAVIGAYPLQGEEPLSVDFDASSSSDPDGDPLQYFWAFGNQGSADSVTASQSFPKGEHRVKLVVADGQGGVATTHESISVSNNSNCDQLYSNNGISITQETANWTTGLIDISCAQSITISMLISGVGPMEDSDYLNVYFSINGGPPIVYFETTNTHQESVSEWNTFSGNTLEITVEGATSAADETYTVSNINVTAN